MRLFAILKLLAGRIKIGSRRIQIGDYLIQWGSVTVTTIPSAKEGFWYMNTTLTFPVAFSEIPLMWLQDNLGGDYLSTNSPSSLTTSNAFIKHLDTRTRETTVRIYWLAIGVA